MVMFSGTYEHTFDDKNRLIIPRRLREKIDTQEEGAGFVVTRGTRRCLFIYTPKAWRQLTEKLAQAAERDPQAQDFLRVFYGNAEEAPCDRQGRILISERLKRLAELQREVAIVGVTNRIEVWDLARWNDFIQSQEEAYDQYGRQVLPNF
jgi:MraZ protein